LENQVKVSDLEKDSHLATPALTQWPGVKRMVLVLALVLPAWDSSPSLPRVRTKELPPPALAWKTSFHSMMLSWKAASNSKQRATERSPGFLFQLSHSWSVKRAGWHE